MKTKILSPLRRDGYKAGMIMMLIALSTMLLTTACSNEDDIVNAENTENTIKKGFELPVTINVTRQDDGATRATYNESTRKLEFSTGDKLFVEGVHIIEAEANRFAGTLTWQSGGTFSGTIYTQNEVPGTADALFTAASASGIVKATLLLNGYESYNFLSIYNNGSDDLYDDVVAWSMQKAFVASETAKATGVEQLSFEQATTYSSGFALAPANAVLNFTISGLTAGAKDVTLSIDYGGLEYPVTGSVTPNASGVATFAIGVPGSNIKDMDNNLTVGTHNFTLPSSTTFTVGKIYNITRCVNAINGKFSVSSTKKVFFSKGNLQLVGENTFQFAENQWDYFGINQSDNHRDLLCWGAGNNPNQTTGNSTFTDWGDNTYLQATLGKGWRTMTKDEFVYVFNTRTSGSSVFGIADGRYTTATINTDDTGVKGLILFPDGITIAASEVTTAGAINGKGTVTQCTTAQWAALAEKGCVFLPAAGFILSGTGIGHGDIADYWSSTAADASKAYNLGFNFGVPGAVVNTAGTLGYNYGLSVRLVCEVPSN